MPAAAGNGDRRRHAGDHFNLDAVLPAELGFLAAAAQDVGVAALEPDHAVALQGFVHEDPVDLRLRHRVVAGGFADLDDADVRGQFVEQFARAEAVRDHDVGLAQQPAAADGDEAGVAGPAADQGHGAAVRRRSPVPAQRQVTGFQGSGDGVAQGHGAARVSPGVDGDLDVVHHGDGGSPGGGGFVVGGVDAPDALRLGVGRNLGVHGGIAGGGLDEPDAVDVGRTVRARLPGEEAGVGEFAQRRRRQREPRR